MKRQPISRAWIMCAVLVAAMNAATAACAVDFEAFEFNDAPGTVLANAANTGIGGIGVWIEDPQMLPSDVRGGVYNIVKNALTLDSNYFQINNITSGTRYLVTRIAGWRFENFDTNEREEFRLGFLHDDDANFGSTITAQAWIRRNAAGNIELFGDALGAGATVLPNTAPLPLIQTDPFTAVLELNKTSNSYKIFYKSGNNPTQVLGLGSVSSTRDGNSVRMAVNNSFGESSIDYPLEIVDYLAVDRIAVSDTNPFTDLITLEIDRGNGAMTLRNTSGAAINSIQSYSITSAAGSLNPAGWDPIGTSVTTSENEELAESFAPNISLGINQTATLSTTPPGAWLKSPFEDVHMTLNTASGPRTVNVNFTGNSGVKWRFGDLTFDNLITGADWLTFISNSETNLSGLSRAEAYQRGDLNGDGLQNIADFIQFRALYEDANGSGSFELMLASVPEPSAACLLTFAAVVAALRRPSRRDARRSNDFATHDLPTGGFRMPRVHTFAAFAAVALLASAAVRPAPAAILEDFPFSDAVDTPLDSVENTANPGNTWILSGNSWDPSAVAAGSYRITKSSAMLASAHLDIANVATGKSWLVAEIAGWNYTATPSGTSEEVRFAYLDNDNDPPSGSTITAQMDIRRMGDGVALVGRGALGTGATDVAGSYALPLVRNTPFTVVLELDKTLDKYSVYYKDNAAPYALLGTAELGASTLNPGDRDGNSLRFATTGQFNDTGEFFDISRIYLTDTSPIGGPVDPVALTLQAFSNGEIKILNDTDDPIRFNSYRITSPTSSLNFGGWDSLSDQGVSAVDGPDPGLIAGDGIGETWDEAGGSNDSVLAESFLLGHTSLAPGDSVSLGQAFKIGGDENLSFQYHDFDTGAIVTGLIDYLDAAGVTGDYNNNGIVDAADYVVWRNAVTAGAMSLPNRDPNNGGAVGPADYTSWRARFGRTSGSGSFSTASTFAVPEPAAWLLLAIGVVAPCVRRRVRTRGASGFTL